MTAASGGPVLGSSAKRVLALLFAVLSGIGSTLSGEDAPESVPVQSRVCWHDVKYYKGDEPIFKAIPDSQTKGPEGFYFLEEIIPHLLLGARYTNYLQLNKVVSPNEVSPYVSGTYHLCTLGCLKEFTYYGVTYRDKCIDKICPEGPVAGKPNFCDPELGPDIYYPHQMFFCETHPRLLMSCGEGARCVEFVKGDPRCVPLTYEGPPSYDETPGTEEQPAEDLRGEDRYGSGLEAPSARGQEIWRQTVSGLSLPGLLVSEGPVDEGPVGFYAEEKGLSRDVRAIPGSHESTGALFSPTQRHLLAPRMWGVKCPVP